VWRFFGGSGDDERVPDDAVRDVFRLDLVDALVHQVTESQHAAFAGTGQVHVGAALCVTSVHHRLPGRFPTAITIGRDRSGFTKMRKQK
jgi:hypothetical protein